MTDMRFWQVDWLGSCERGSSGWRAYLDDPSSVSPTVGRTRYIKCRFLDISASAAEPSHNSQAFRLLLIEKTKYICSLVIVRLFVFDCLHARTKYTCSLCTYSYFEFHNCSGITKITLKYEHFLRKSKCVHSIVSADKSRKFNFGKVSCIVCNTHVYQPPLSQEEDCHSQSLWHLVEISRFQKLWSQSLTPVRLQV